MKLTSFTLTGQGALDAALVLKDDLWEMVADQDLVDVCQTPSQMIYLEGLSSKYKLKVLWERYEAPGDRAGQTYSGNFIIEAAPEQDMRGVLFSNLAGYYENLKSISIYDNWNYQFDDEIKRITYAGVLVDVLWRESTKWSYAYQRTFPEPRATILNGRLAQDKARRRGKIVTRKGNPNPVLFRVPHR